MDIDARFVKDIDAGDRINIIQFVAHLGLVDASHYYIRTVATQEWGRMVPGIAHAAAHSHFDAIADEFGAFIRDFLSQVYCRAFMRTCAYFMTRRSKSDAMSKDIVDKLVDEGRLELRFIGLESTASGGVSVVRLYEKEDF